MPRSLLSVVSVGLVTRLWLCLTVSAARSTHDHCTRQASRMTCDSDVRDRIISSHFAGKLNSFNMALTPLPPPAILKCGGHILLNAYMHAMHRPSPTTRWRCPWRWYAAPRMSRAAVTLGTVEIAGLIADDQRLFTPLAQATPMTCKREGSLWAVCLFGHQPYLHLYLQLTTSCTSIAERRRAGFVARPEQATQEAPHGKCGLSARSPLS